MSESSENIPSRLTIPPPPQSYTRGRSSSSSTVDTIDSMQEFNPPSRPTIPNMSNISTPRMNSPPPPPISSHNNVGDERIKVIFEELSSNYFTIAAEERKKQDNLQLNHIQTILKDWTENITIKTKLLVEESLTAATSQNDMENINAALSDAQSRRSKILEDIKEAHNLQLQILKMEIAEERREAAQAQIVFEQTLRTKYDNLVIALQEKIKIEQEARMQRALEDLERSARLESERAKQSMELQQAAEVALSTKFKSIVGDLRKSWEDEELQRAKFLEERLRGHYSAVLEHMESQLHMALQLQDDADKRWMEDVQERNRQQIESMKAFEEKCTRLYDSRLKEYVIQSEDMINQYESQLLQVGNTLAMERYQFESRQRRLRLACSKWKVDYQKQLHEKYRELLDSMEQRYGSEIESLLQQIASLRQGIADSQHDIRNLEQNTFNHASSSNNKLNLHGMPIRRASSIRTELEGMWTETTTPQERIDALAALLDEAEVTPELMAKYHDISSKLSSRLPIIQAIARKQFIEYKIKLAHRAAGSNMTGNDGSPMKSLIPAELTNELTELSQYIQQAIDQYENLYQEAFHRMEGEVASGPGTRIDGPSKNLNPNVLPSPMSGFPNAFFGGNAGISPTNSSAITSSINRSSAVVGGSPPGSSMTRNGSSSITGSGSRGVTSTIHRKYVSSPDGVVARK